jgi:hypothetical protein
MASNADYVLPNLYDKSAFKTTFWKHILTYGPQSEQMFSDVQDAVGISESVDINGLFQDGIIRDQIISFASTTFKTSVMNNCYVPLIPRLKRLCNMIANSHEFRNEHISGWKLLSAIRCIDSNEKVADLSALAKEFREEVRKRLCVPATSYIFDDYAKPKTNGVTFNTIYRFNHWMHGMLVAHEKRGIKLSSIFRVRRACVRLDEKILARLAYLVLPKHPETWTNVYASGPLRKQLIDQIMSPSVAKIRGNKRFDYTMTTDGVVANISYETPRVKKKTVSTSKAQKMKKQKKKKSDASPSSYDKKLSTLMKDQTGAPTRLVVGVDPGRTNIATISYYIDDTNISKSWTLTRCQYYAESGIRRIESARSKRFKSLEAYWSELGNFENEDEGEKATSALKTADPTHVLQYIESSLQLRDAWWELALRRRESRYNFQKYIGKRKVIDSFFSSVAKDLHDMFPGVPVEIAYGQAYVSMKSSGHGELAVPTTGAFKSCVLAFSGGNDRVSVVDERYTSQMHWDTGRRFERVYMCSGKNDLLHLPYEANAVVPQERITRVLRLNKKLVMERAAMRRRRRPVGPTQPAAVTKYPEVRGLRFVTETRKYLSRDVTSAIAIARLRVLELSGLERPEVYC